MKCKKKYHIERGMPKNAYKNQPFKTINTAEISAQKKLQNGPGKENNQLFKCITSTWYLLVLYQKAG